MSFMNKIEKAPYSLAYYCVKKSIGTAKDLRTSDNKAWGVAKSVFQAMAAVPALCFDLFYSPFIIGAKIVVSLTKSDKNGIDNRNKVQKQEDNIIREYLNRKNFLKKNDLCRFLFDDSFQYDENKMYDLSVEEIATCDGNSMFLPFKKNREFLEAMQKKYPEEIKHLNSADNLRSHYSSDPQASNRFANNDVVYHFREAKKYPRITDLLKESIRYLILRNVKR